MKDSSADPWLLHFTPIANLPGIISHGLISDSQDRQGAHECGQPSIKARRRRRHVPIPPGGVVADYAPFYFAARSPMLRSILGGRVKEYEGDQTHLIYLLTRLSRVIDHGLSWVATDRNAVLGTAKFTSDRQRLAEHVDWEIMETQFWGNTPEDGSRRERRMAELLVHGAVPWAAFSHVGVCCDTRVEEVRASLPAGDEKTRILVKPDWYFDVPSSCPCQGLLGRRGGEPSDR